MQKIIIIEPNYLGDVLMTTPVIHILNKYVFGKKEITIIVHQKVKDALIGNPDIDHLIYYDRDRITERIKILSFIKHLGPDYVFLFRTTFFNILLARMSKAKQTVGIDVYGSKFFLTHALSYDKNRNYRNECLSIVNEVYPFLYHLRNELNRIVFSVSKEDEKYIDELLFKNDIKENEKIIVINPSTTRFAKLWLPQNYAFIIDYLIRNNFKVIITTTFSNLFFIKDILKETKSQPIVFDNLSIKQLAALIKKSCLFISPDTGPMYIASAFNKNIISFFGSTDPQKYGPFNKLNHRIIYKNFPCSPCYKNYCPLVSKNKFSKCMENITEKEVLEEIKNFNL